MSAGGRRSVLVQHGMAFKGVLLLRDTILRHSLVLASFGCQVLACLPRNIRYGNLHSSYRTIRPFSSPDANVSRAASTYSLLPWLSIGPSLVQSQCSASIDRS
jgi:hypothetical protein